MARIVVTNRIHDAVADRLARAGELDLNTSDAPLTQDELKAKLGAADAMMGFMTDCVDREVLACAPHLLVVAGAFKGFDSYDVDACTAAGVWVTIVPDLLTAPTAELAVGLAIGLGRRIREAAQVVHWGQFNGWRPQFYGSGLDDSKVAIVGLGKVGRAIVTRLAGFGCKLLGVDPHVGEVPQTERVTLDQALTRADYVILAVPLTSATLHLIGRPQLEIAKPGSLWINVGRGSVMDEAAMLWALETDRIGGYAADVFAFEDWRLPDRPPAILPRLLQHPRTLFTPHIGSAVASVRLAIEHRAADNILAVLAGKAPPDAINRPMTRPTGE